MASSVKDKVILVTGGASGIGRATVETLIGAEAYVFILDIATSEGDIVAKKLGERCFFINGDVKSTADVEHCLRQIKTQFGRLYAVINCAAIFSPTQLSQTSSSTFMDVFENSFQVNAAGTMRVISETLPLMKENAPNDDGERGVIINVSSIFAEDGLINTTAHTGSKGCINAMTLPLARDLGQFGIRVNCVQPGLIDTPMSRPVREDGFDAVVQSFPFPKRAGRPEEVAHLIYFLLQNKFINGEIIRIDAAHRSNH